MKYNNLRLYNIYIKVLILSFININYLSYNYYDFIIK